MLGGKAMGNVFKSSSTSDYEIASWEIQLKRCRLTTGEPFSRRMTRSEKDKNHRKRKKSTKKLHSPALFSLLLSSSSLSISITCWKATWWAGFSISILWVPVLPIGCDDVDEWIVEFLATRYHCSSYFYFYEELSIDRAKSEALYGSPRSYETMRNNWWAKPSVAEVRSYIAKVGASSSCLRSMARVLCWQSYHFLSTIPN